VRSIVYEIRSNEDVSGIFPNDGRQTLAASKDDPKVGTLEVRTSVQGPEDPQPGPEYLSSNPLVTSDDSAVRNLTRKAIGRATDPWQQAIAIEKWVARNLTEKNFKTAFAPASEVARNLTGDCSEHSVLVAAMCRAAGIPSRCVVGMAYVRERSGFGPHMWVEVYVKGRWQPIDAAYDQSEVDATHLKFSTSSLQGVSPLDTFTPVLKAFNGLKIEPKEIR
jgi:transglutaminase-like putative cysteine protease